MVHTFKRVDIAPVNLIQEMHFVRRLASSQAGIHSECGTWFWKRKVRLSDGTTDSKNTRIVLDVGRTGQSICTSCHPSFYLKKVRLTMDSNTKLIHKKHSSNHANAIKFEMNAHEHGKTPQTQRRHYTPRSISQQAVDVNLPDEQPVDNHNMETHSSYDQNYSLHLPVSRDYKHTRRELLRRPLGGIEQMYNIYSSQGTDIICLMTKIETIYPVTSSAVAEALNLLQQRHPLFRMSIRKSRYFDDGHLDFVENEKASFDFAIYDRSDWLQCMLEELDHHSTGKSRSLIRCRMLNSSLITKRGKEASRVVANECTEPAGVDCEKEFEYQATFLFIMHHSIMDGGYSLWMFQEFINFLDAVVMNIDMGRVKELPLLPPFENIFTFTCDGSDEKNVDMKESALSFCHDSTDDTLLKAYNKTFHNEIDISPSKKLRNDCIVFKFSKMQTRTFVQTIKSKKCTPKGAIIAASALALLELVYQDKFGEMCNNISIPIEYMADFRRIGDFQLPDDGVPHYPGVAALHIPLLAQLRLGGSRITSEIFWKKAQQFGECLDKNVDSPEVYEWIKEEAAKYYRFPVQTEVRGKSPYVLSVSNMGKIDAVLNSDVSGRVRLVDLHGHSSILVDEMPLFCVTTFALNGHFCGNVSFCSNYTTNKTATKYVGLIQKYLCSYSML